MSLHINIFPKVLLTFSTKQDICKIPLSEASDLLKCENADKQTPFILGLTLVEYRHYRELNISQHNTGHILDKVVSSSIPPLTFNLELFLSALWSGQI